MTLGPQHALDSAPDAPIIFTFNRYFIDSSLYEYAYEISSIGFDLIVLFLITNIFLFFIFFGYLRDNEYTEKKNVLQPRCRPNSFSFRGEIL